MEYAKSENFKYLVIKASHGVFTLPGLLLMYSWRLSIMINTSGWVWILVVTSDVSELLQFAQSLSSNSSIPKSRWINSFKDICDLSWGKLNIISVKLGWQCRDLCLWAPPPKQQTFLSVANMSGMLARHIGDILLCRPIFWLSASCRGILLPTHFPIRKQESVLVRYVLLHPGI